MLVGNKCDKSYEREVTREEGVDLARSFECEFLETSAKTGVNVERLFTVLVRKLRESRHDGAPTGPPAQAPGPGLGKKKPRCMIL